MKPQMTPEQKRIADLMAEAARLRAENEALKARPAANERAITYAISAKGAISVYGVGRFPTTLYATQWAKLLGHADQLKAFVEEAVRLKAVALDKNAPFAQPSGLSPKFIAKVPSAQTSAPTADSDSAF